jgi:periplasmic protein TonB
MQAMAPHVIRWLRQRSTLQWALGISLVFHAALLTIRAVDPVGFNRLFENTPLEVILVNTQSDRAPDQAQAIAQASLAGGGSANTGMASAPLPSMAAAQVGNAPEPQQAALAALRQRQQALLTQVRQQIAQLPPVDPNASANTPQALEEERKRQALLNMLAQIEKRIQEENARPRKHYISPATREAVYAVYYDALRQQIEDQGTRQFPQQDGQKLYGELTMVITVNHTGEVLDTEIAQRSQSPALDRRAQAIVRSQRFSAFTPTMRRQADHIVVVSRFRFTRNETLQTQLRNQ